MAASVINGSGLLCYGLYSDSCLTCVSETPGGMNLPWGAAGVPKIYYGDAFYRSIIGKESDARYYATGLSECDLNTLFTQRKAACSLHCQICSDLVTCTQCEIGLYLDANSNCVLCNACCVECTGPGNSACLSCAPLCISTAPTTCIRNY